MQYLSAIPISPSKDRLCKERNRSLAVEHFAGVANIVPPLTSATSIKNRCRREREREGRGREGGRDEC